MSKLLLLIHYLKWRTFAIKKTSNSQKTYKIQIKSL